MANRGESLINAVSSDKPKMLIGLNQKGEGIGRKVSSVLSRGQVILGE